MVKGALAVDASVVARCFVHLWDEGTTVKSCYWVLREGTETGKGRYYAYGDRTWVKTQAKAAKLETKPCDTTRCRRVKIVPKSVRAAERWLALTGAQKKSVVLFLLKEAQESGSAADPYQFAAELLNELWQEQVK